MAKPTAPNATLEELAAVLDKVKTSVSRLATDENWQFVEVDARSRHKRREYPLATLPTELRQQIMQYRLKRILKQPVSSLVTAQGASSENGVSTQGELVALSAPQAVTFLAPVKVKRCLTEVTDKQRQAADARLLIKAAIHHLQAGGLTQEKALHTLLMQAQNQQLPAEVMSAINAAKAKREGLPSVRTLKRWLAVDDAASLVPKVRGNSESPDWLVFFLAAYRVPQRPNLAETYRAGCHTMQLNGYDELPSIHQMRRYLLRVPHHLLMMGRFTGSEYNAMAPFVRRDWSGSSNECWVGDGHTFKAKVRHPDHGKPFAPEVTVIIDANSRMIVGWAYSLSENQVAVSEALGNGMIKYGKPLIYYSDNGSGQTAKTIDCPVGGMLARLGVKHETGIPGNPQGRGIIEGLWDITAIAVAKTFPTFQGTGMDAGALRKNRSEIDKAGRQGLVPEFVPAWEMFKLACDEAFERYNLEHKHSALKGRTPAEVYATCKDDLLSLPLSDDEKRTLYHPFVERTTNRGEIQLFRNRYFLRKLEELQPGTKVRVIYDLNNAEKVWIADLEGRMIGEAQWDGNKHKAFPESYVEQLREKRREGIINRAQVKIDLANEEVSVIEGELVRPELDLIPAVLPELVKPDLDLTPTEKPKLQVISHDFMKQPSEEEKQKSYDDICQLLYGNQEP